MFSKRLAWDPEINAITRAVRERRTRGEALIDLTISNPTAAGFLPPPDLAEALVRGAAGRYEPSPRGSERAREALAGWLRRHGAPAASANELFLCSSTSEAYGWILRILCDPGDRVVRFAPTYPLLDHLAQLDAVALDTVSLERAADGWGLPGDEEIARAIDGARALIVVHPNNPTSQYLTPADVERLSALAQRHDVALIADEVFFEATRGDHARVASHADCLTFSLGGLSKSAALPHWKLGWVRVTGPPDRADRGKRALELVADAYLPVSAMVERALPQILDRSDSLRTPLLERIEANLARLDAAITTAPALHRDRFEGGWSVPLRVPLLRSEEELVVDLIEGGVLVHPGYFYDYPTPGWLVVSLLTPEPDFAEGLAKVVDGIGMT